MEKIKSNAEKEKPQPFRQSFNLAWYIASLQKGTVENLS